MDFMRVIKNSKDLEKIIDIPKGLKNRKVEIIILPFTDIEKSKKKDKKSVRGALSKYQNATLQDKERDAWSKSVVDKHEHN